jgi:hypothetical protein
MNAKGCSVFGVFGDLVKIHGAVLGPFQVVGISGATVSLATGSTEFKAAKTYRRHITSLVKFFRKDSV